MAQRQSRAWRPLTMVILLAVGLVVYGVWIIFGLSLIAPGDSDEGRLNDQAHILNRQAGSALALSQRQEPIDLTYLQQFCPELVDLASPRLCTLKGEQIEAFNQQLPPEAVACWQQIYDYAFGPQAGQLYLGDVPAPTDRQQPVIEGEVSCHEGVITVLVQPSFVSPIEADNRDAARYQDVLFVMAAVIEYEAYRGRNPTNWSQLAGAVNFSYYDPTNVNLPGTWDIYPAQGGEILTLTQGLAGPGQISVDAETGHLPLPISGRWGDDDQLTDPQLLMIFHRAACDASSPSSVKLGGLRRYAIVYRPSAESGFSCHDF